MEEHKLAVSTVATRVRYFYGAKKPFRIYHGSTSSTRPSQHWKDNTVDVSSLSNVLGVDTQKKVALVEPNVPMDKFVDTTMRYGLVAPVIMEFPGITVGGGFAGSSGESGSFRYGLFERTVNWIEIVLGNGDTLNASSSENSDLFYGAASSFGTLGVTTLLEVQLIDAKPFVALTYHLVDGISSALQILNEAGADPYTNYLDGILFAKDKGVVCVGHMVDAPGRDHRVERFTRSTDPWFYIRAKKLLPTLKQGPFTDYVPLADYLFRYDRGAFWGGAYAFQYFVTPFNRITRWALDWFMHTRVMYHALHKSGISKQIVVQDMGVPYESADEFAHHIDSSIGCYPLWLCPVSQQGIHKTAPRGLWFQREAYDDQNSDTLLNFGIWCFGPKDRSEFVEMNRNLEHKVTDLKGLKCLYAHAYYTEDEFWSIYDKERYDKLRMKYHATHLPTVYDKVKVDTSAEEKAIQESWKAWLLAIFWSIWPLSGFYGVLHTLLRSNYLLRRGGMKSS